MKAMKAYDNGGKVKKTANVNTRGEGKKKKKKKKEGQPYPLFERDSAGPGRAEYIAQERASHGSLKKLKPKEAKPIASKPLPAKELNKPTAVIPVPPARRRRRRKNRK